jgi:hypothetical protein
MLVLHFPFLGSVLWHQTTANRQTLDVQKYLPVWVDSENYGHYEDQKKIDLDEAMLHAADLPTQHALMHDFEKSGLGGTLARRIAPDPKPVVRRRIA